MFKDLKTTAAIGNAYAEDVVNNVPNQKKIFQIVGWTAIAAYTYGAYRLVKGVVKVGKHIKH